MLSPTRATAQQTRQSEPPILELTTSHHNLGWHVAKALAGEDFRGLDFPDLEDDQQVRVVLGSDRQLQSSAVAAGKYVLELRVRRDPEVLAKIVTERLGHARRLLHLLTFTTLTAQMQMEARHAARAIQSVLHFHRQLEDLHLTMRKTKDSANGYAIDLLLTPKQGTWLQEVVGGIRASETGAPHLRSPNATLTVTAAARGKGLARFLEPFADHLGRIRGKNRNERKQFMVLARQRLPHFDGCFSLMIDGPGRYVRMIGLQKPEDYSRQAAQKNWLSFDCRRAGRANVLIAQAEAMPRALAGSGIQILLKETDLFAFTEEDAPPGEDDKDKQAGQPPGRRLTTFAGVVEDFSLKARLPDGGKEMARLVNRVRQKQLKRMPLIDGALLHGQINLGQGVRLLQHPNEEFQEAIEPFKEMIAELWKQIPENIHVAVYKRGEKLQVQVRTR
ncbi:MAG: hypothetical protein V3U11_13410 [Planctomycetota bacterium]